MKKALITGITGQDGSYLAEQLLDLGYEVHGIVRRSSSFNTGRIDHIFSRLKLHYGDLTDQNSVISIVAEVRPDEIYHLAAMSHVKVSFEMPAYAVQSTALGTLNILEAVRALKLDTKIYNASSSEMFGSAPPPQKPTTVFHPCSPYACGKIAAHNLCVNYRESYGMYVVNGILFNHESPRRGETFVTRKITKAAARIKHGKQSELVLGNLDAYRDWGYAKEYTEAMRLMLQQEKPRDYVLGTQTSYSVQDFLEVSFGYLSLDWRKYVKIDPKYYRPSEVDHLHADVGDTYEVLNWKPKTYMRDLACIMTEHDYKKEF